MDYFKTYFFITYKSEQKVILLGDTEIEKGKLHYYKNQILRDDRDINKNYKDFIGYKDDNYKVLMKLNVYRFL